MTRRIFFSTWIVVALFMQTAVFAMPCCYAMSLPSGSVHTAGVEPASHQAAHDCEHMMGSRVAMEAVADMNAHHVSTVDSGHGSSADTTCPMSGVMLISQPMWFDDSAEHTLNDSGGSVLFATVPALPLSHISQRLERPPRLA